MQQTSIPEYVDQLEQGQWYFSLATTNCFRILDTDLEFDEEHGISRGTVEIELAVSDTEGDTETERCKAERLREEGLPEELVPVSERVVSDPTETLLAFASNELDDYTSTLSSTHPYHGVDGVKSIACLEAARRIRERRQRLASEP